MRKMLLLMGIAFLFALSAMAQVRTISGKITDDKGDPAPYVTITIKGTKNIVAANDLGIFTIKAKTGDVLVISGVGLQTQEVKITNEPTVSISMVRQSNSISEVVVTTALGIQKQAKELGYSATTLQSKDLVVAKPVSVVNGLTGKVSGLQINTVNNDVFAPTRVTLRGNRSLTGNNQPLIVVDGAIFYNDISTLNPDNINDVNILKGASASAIYGSDASNGVIIITTKKGVRGKPSLTFSSTVQLETLSYMMALQNQFGSNGGEAFVNDFNDLSTYIPYENQSYGPRYNGKIVPLGRPVADGSLLTVPYSALPDEKRKFFNTGITTQNNISYQGGDENSRFFINLQDVNTKAIMPGNYGRRDVFSIGGSKSYGIFSATYNASYTYKYTNVTNTGTVYENVMNTPAHVPLTSLKDWKNNKFADLNGFYNDYFDNPYWDIDNMRNKTTDNTFTGNLQLNLKPLKWVNLSYRLTASEWTSRYEYIQNPKTYSTYARTNSTVIYSSPSGNKFDTVLESPKFTASSAGVNGIAATYTNSNYNNFLLTSDFVASVDKNLSSKFNLKASLGTSYIDNTISGIYVNAPALVIPVFNITSVSGTVNVGSTGNNYFKEARKFGVFGEATLGYRNFAFVHGSYRGDIDSRLSKDNRFIPYYDVDASLILSDIFPTISTNKGLSFLKLRFAHSLTGNASPLGGGSKYIAGGAYGIYPTYNVATGFPMGVGGYSISTTVANPNIKPEQVTENEVGLEVGLLKNRFYLTAVYYQSELVDGIVTANTASSSGFYNALINAAHTKNSGLELELKANILRTKNLSWNLSTNYTHTTSNVVSIAGGVKSLGLGGANGNAFAVVGNPFPVIQTRDWVRDAQGKVIVSSVTGNPTRASALSIFGGATPTDIVGLTSTLTYKDFTLTITGDYRGGYNIFNSIGQYSDFTGISATSASQNRQRFVFPNSVTVDGSGKSVPNTTITTDDGNFNFWPGLYRSVGGNYVTSAAALKLREVAIGYEIPKKVFGFTKVIQRANFTLSGRNLLMIRPKTNLWTDPEFSEDTGNGVGRTSENQAPPTRIFSATLSVTF